MSFVKLNADVIHALVTVTGPVNSIVDETMGTGENRCGYEESMSRISVERKTEKIMQMADSPGLPATLEVLPLRGIADVDTDINDDNAVVCGPQLDNVVVSKHRVPDVATTPEVIAEKEGVQKADSTRQISVNSIYCNIRLQHLPLRGISDADIAMTDDNVVAAEPRVSNVAIPPEVITEKEGLQKADSTRQIPVNSLYYNINGWSNKKVVLVENILEKKGIDVFAITEHKKNRKHDLPVSQAYDRWASCRETERGGGTTIWVRKGKFLRVSTIPMAPMKKKWTLDLVELR